MNFWNQLNLFNAAPVVQTWESQFSSPLEQTPSRLTNEVFAIGRRVLNQNPPMSLPGISMPLGNSRYRTTSGYIFDTVITRPPHVQTLFSRHSSEQYSSNRKTFYGPTPNQPCNYEPVQGRFDITCLGQKKVLDVINCSQNVNKESGEVPLSTVISPLLKKMGTMTHKETGANLGTCTLIAENLVITSRHAVQGVNILNIQVAFGYTEDDGFLYVAGETSFEEFIEEDPDCDYAIIKLKKPLGKRLGYAPLSAESSTSSEPALLHYPLGKTLRVSVHRCIETEYEERRSQSYHDSDYCSSGGAYFDTSGHMRAMHLGSESKGDTMNVCRYAVPINEIVRRNPNSILAKFVRKERSQTCSYKSDVCFTRLFVAYHNYLIDEEGRQSERILRGYLTSKLGSLKEDKNIRINKKSGTISFRKKNLQYIAEKYPNEYKKTVRKCLRRSGLHRHTREYAMSGVIESDHTIPYAVFNGTKNKTMNAITKAGKGKRPGENDMPAITIPWGKHRDLQTTGSSARSKKFRKKLTSLCNQGKVDQALIKCYDDYERVGINFQSIEKAIKKSLSQHVNMGLISKAGKRNIIKRYYE